jgi:phosphoglycolate phosphatase
MVMFDLDGTLVDSVPDLAFAINAMLQDAGALPVKESQVRQWVGNGAVKLVERALIHADLSIAPINVETSLVLFKQYYQQHCAVGTCLYDGVIRCLQALHERNIVMTIVTNKPREFVPAILASLGIAHFFTLIIGGDDLAERKPSPLPLLHCIKQMQCAIETVMMVGDSKNDIDAARQAGIPVVAVNYGYNHGRPIALENPDKVLSSLHELVQPSAI